MHVPQQIAVFHLRTGLRRHSGSAPLARRRGTRTMTRRTKPRRPPITAIMTMRRVRTSCSSRPARPPAAQSMLKAAQISYKAVAGTLVVHPEGWDDTNGGSRRRAGTRTRTKASPMRKRACSTSLISRMARRPRTARSPSSTTAGPVPRRSGCTWARSGRGASSPAMIRTRLRRPIAWSTTTTACSTAPISSSLTRRARASPGSRARTRPSRSTAWMQTGTPSRNSSRSSSASTTAGIVPNICSARAMARRVRRSSSTI